MQLCPSSLYDADTRSSPLVFDGYSALHASYGILATVVLQNGAHVVYWATFLIVFYGAILWEVVEARTSIVKCIFRRKTYEGDSAENMVSDVAIAVMGWAFSNFVPQPANWITGASLFGTGVLWSVARAMRLGKRQDQSYDSFPLQNL